MYSFSYHQVKENKMHDKSGSLHNHVAIGNCSLLNIRTNNCDRILKQLLHTNQQVGCITWHYSKNSNSKLINERSKKLTSSIYHQSIQCYDMSSNSSVITKYSSPVTDIKRNKENRWSPIPLVTKLAVQNIIIMQKSRSTRQNKGRHMIKDGYNLTE